MRKYGYVKTAAAAFEVCLANPIENAKKIVRISRESDSKDVDVLVFQELSLTGYTCADLFLQSTMKEQVNQGIEYICENTVDVDTLLVVGLPVYVDGMLFNAAAFIFHGEVLGIVPKTFIPNYGEFYEKRWFAPASSCFSDKMFFNGKEVPFTPNLIVSMDNGANVACEICEDLWVNMPPSSRHTLFGANIIANPSASDAVISKAKYRTELVKGQSARCVCAYIYTSAGAGESVTDLVFDGHCIIAEGGHLLVNKQAMEEEILEALVDVEKLENDRRRYNSNFYEHPKADYVKINIVQSRQREPLPEKINAYPFVPKSKDGRSERCKEILDIQAMGLAGRLKKIGNPKAVVGISGGLDSTLALLVIKRAFEMDNRDLKDVIAITMPGFGTTDRTKSNSTKLMEMLGVTMREISIKDACIQHMKDIGHPENQFDVTYENIQARERTKILMNVANSQGGIVVGTGDLSELALGWCTYNGDHMSMYGVNASVPKTLVKYIIESYALNCGDKEIGEVLLDICDTPISPELLPTDEQGNMVQKTESTIGKYDLHDFFLYNFVRNGFTKEKIGVLAEIAFGNIPKEEIENTLNVFMKRFYSQQFKRSCMPDGPKVGTVCLSPRGDWRMPSDI